MKKRVNGAWVTTSPLKYGTSTDTITTLPADLYADGQSATVGLVGNMSQSGTPTPTTPIQPQECGERTGNLFDEVYSSIDTTIRYKPIYVGDGTFTLSTTTPYDLSVANLFLLSGNVTSGASTMANGAWLNHNVTAQSVDGYVTIAYRRYNNTTSPAECKTMLNTGSTALPYEPFGVKIPILSGGTTTPVYLGEVQTTRKVKKYEFTGQETFGAVGSVFTITLRDAMGVAQTTKTDAICTHYQAQRYDRVYSGTEFGFAQRLGSAENTRGFAFSKGEFETPQDFQTYLAQQYAAGTPVTIGYVLATEETGIVNEPLRKIGDYADTVSGITIPTITGKDTLDVQTTLKPSEVSLSYTGWHDATVKEWDGSEWQDEQPVSLLSASSRPTLTENTTDIMDITEPEEKE